jgi:hypothetical protein
MDNGLPKRMCDATETWMESFDYSLLEDPTEGSQDKDDELSWLSIPSSNTPDESQTRWMDEIHVIQSCINPVM